MEGELSPQSSPRRPLPLLLLLLVAVVVLLVVALVASAIAGFAQYRQVQHLRAEVAELSAELETVRDQLAQDAETPATDNPLAGLLDDLLGGDGDLDGLLDGGLDGLLGGGLEGLPGAELLGCLQPQGATPTATLPRQPLAEQTAAIAGRVEELRDLTFTDPPEPVVEAPGDFRAGLVERITAGYPEEEAELDRRILAALAAIPTETDLWRLAVDLVGDQSVGYYDSDTGEIVVRGDSDADELGTVEQVTLAHELEHALADQALGLPDTDSVDGDAARAALALVEGDAVVTMQQFALSALEVGDQLALSLDPGMMASRAQLETYPAFLRDELLFPYTDGLAFVCGLYADGGWAAVDAAYADPPTTSAQVLYPERYTDREPAAEVSAPPHPGSGWDEVHTDSFGAAELRSLFAAPGGDPGAELDRPDERAAAWAGGTVTLWTAGQDSAVALRLVERPGHDGLCASVRDWYAAAQPDGGDAGPSGDEVLARSGDPQSGVVACTSDEVRVGIAPDLAEARAVTR
ncbi:MAG: hypothetical protein GEU81_01620 [Nitriliruptorales bacterium]|nr:hypothetical protein [Nitriliruptorales bacterium]